MPGRVSFCFSFKTANSEYLLVKARLRKKKPETLPGDADIGQTAGNAEDPSEILHKREMEELIEQCIAGLPEQSRRVYKMSRDEGLKYREIAEALKISEKTVEGHMNRALRTLKKALENYQKDSG